MLVLPKILLNLDVGISRPSAMLNKHEKIARPALGHFARTELAILGTSCDQIKQLAYRCIQQLADSFAIAYVDADHPGADRQTEAGPDPQLALTYGATIGFTDKITHSQFEHSFIHRPRALGYERVEGHPVANSLQINSYLGSADLVLVNGNHFEAQGQVVVIDPAKPLTKKLGKLTQIKLVVLQTGVTEVPAEVKALLEPGVPVMALSESTRIIEWLRDYLLGRVPPLYGLVLAGGHSARMGQDKGLIQYHGQPQREHAHQMAQHFCTRTFVSCRADQSGELTDRGLATITDSFLGLGPLGGILSAFREHPDAAWLVLATDLPLLTDTTLAHLVQHRQAQKIATAFVGNDGSGFPEPLISIWEPKAYPVLLQFLAMGYNCPRKVLINSDINLLEAPAPVEFTNVNLPAEHQVVLAKLGKQ